jgi:hypothetical protein
MNGESRTWNRMSYFFVVREDVYRRLAVAPIDLPQRTNFLYPNRSRSTSITA